MWRLEAFDLERLQTPERLAAWVGRAKSHPRDERVFVFAEIFGAPSEMTGGRQPELWELERAYFESLRVVREAQSRRSARTRLRGNRMTFFLRPEVVVNAKTLARLAQRLEAPTRGLGLEKVVLIANAGGADGEVRERVFVLRTTGRHRLEVREVEPSQTPLRPMTPYRMAVQRARRLGTIYPYEIAAMLEGRTPGTAPHPDLEGGRFTEY